MNSEKEKIISRRYARAFVNIFHSNILDEEILKIKTVCDALAEKKGAKLFLRLGLISSDRKRKYIERILSKFDFKGPWNSLVVLLVRHKRIFLFGQVLFYIEKFYLDLVGLVKWNISSAIKLEDSQEKQFEKFLMKKSKKNALCTYSVDKNLIAGVRAHSDNLLWEYSVKRKLFNVEKVIINQEVL